MNYTYDSFTETFGTDRPIITSVTAGDGDVFTVGKDGVEEIRQHPAQGEGDRWFYDVEYKNGKYLRLFDFKWALYSHPPVEVSHE